MRLTQEVIEKIQLAMTHTKMNGETNWKDGDEIDVCLGGTFAGDKFISIINRTRSNTTKKYIMWYIIGWTIVTMWLLSKFGVFKKK